jgi:alkaline phosphatase
MRYVDGFVLVVPKKKLKAYTKMAKDASKVWKKFGALEYKECVAEDMHPENITFTFPKMAKAKKNETVFFSFIVYKSRAHRDSVNKKVMAYFSKKYKDNMHDDMPFDMKRMAYGGFKAVVDL